MEANSRRYFKDPKEVSFVIPPSQTAGLAQAEKAQSMPSARTAHIATTAATEFQGLSRDRVAKRTAFSELLAVTATTAPKVPGQAPVRKGEGLARSRAVRRNNGEAGRVMVRTGPPKPTVEDGDEDEGIGMLENATRRPEAWF